MIYVDRSYKTNRENGQCCHTGERHCCDADLDFGSDLDFKQTYLTHSHLEGTHAPLSRMKIT